MIRQIASLGRRGLLRGALGLGAAVGLGAPRSPGAGNAPIVGSFLSMEDSDQIHEAEQRTQRQTAAIYDRPIFDGLDLDIAMLRSPSPAWKMVMQQRRDRDRRERSQSLWDAFRKLSRQVRRIG